MSDLRELPLDRPSSFDDQGRRRKIHPTPVSGFFHRRRELLKFVLILFFLSVPWIKVNGHPLLLLDIQNRIFSLFGVVFRAHDLPIVVLFLLLFTTTIGWLTTLYGRVWCGWACPQTVFIEFVYRRIETWIEGDAITRRKMDQGPFTFDRFAKLAIKWALFLAFTLVITHSLLAVFVGTERLPVLLSSPPSENLFFFLFTWILTGILLLDFGFLREQFCIVMCPYGKMQSVFQDAHSLAITYDSARGEPRRSIDTKTHGDCIDCYKCVQVCPTGIDIRRGSNQLECIGCTACADACDSVMERLKKPLGLIKYNSEAQSGHGFLARFFKGRVLAYEVFFLILITILSLTLSRRTDFSVEIFKVRGAPYTQIDSEWLSNSFHLELGNESFHAKTFTVELPEGVNPSSIRLLIPNNSVELKSGAIQQIPLTIEFKKELLTLGKTMLPLEVSIKTLSDSAKEPNQRYKAEVTLIGPF
jgi:cytochrome c oxidase accessory protein FixG